MVGRLGDGPHRRTVLLVCLAIVTLGGVLAALAGTLPVLVAGRAMQGLGLALMPLTMASARDHLPADRAGSTIALLSVIGAAGVGLGYPITGFIAEYLDASAAFLFGAVASGLAFAMAAVFVPSPRAPRAPESLDVLGAVLIGERSDRAAAGAGEGRRLGLGRATHRRAAGAGRGAAGPVDHNELRVAEPLVELRLVRRRSVLTANVTGLVLGVAMYLGSR